MFARPLVWSLFVFVSVATVACKENPPPPSAEPTPSATASSATSAAVVRAAPPERGGYRYGCTTDGKVAEGIPLADAAYQKIELEGATSDQARKVVVEALCARDEAVQGCVANETNEGRQSPSTTVVLRVANRAVTEAEGGSTELRACIAKALTGMSAGDATSLKLTFVPNVSERPQPIVRVRDVKPPEGVSADAVTSRLRGKTAALRACYEMALREKAGLEGTVLVEHDLGKDGHTLKSRVKGGTLQHPSLEKCVQTRIGELGFGEPKSGHGKLAYTLTFSSRRGR